MTLLEQSLDLRVTPRVTLLDSQLAEIEDLTARTISLGSGVTYQHDARSPHSATIAITGAALDWGAARIGIDLTLQDVPSRRAIERSLGRYVIGAASRSAQRPDEWRLELQDVSVMLDQATGLTWSVREGETVQSAVARVREAAEVPIVIDDQLRGEFVTASRTWAITESATWLDVLSHLSISTGGRSPYTSRTGELVLSRYVRLDDLPSTLTLDESEITLLEPGAQIETDLYAVPNEILVIADITLDDGTVQRRVERRRNYDSGATSQQRRGWWQRSVYTVDAVSAADLEVAADRIWDDTQYHGLAVSAMLTPTTRLWAHDVLDLDLPTLDLSPARAFVRSWKLPLDGSSMQVTLGVL